MRASAAPVAGSRSSDEDAGSLDWRVFDADDGLTPILRVALELFVRHGYAGTSIRMIAQAAGVTGPGLYYHYKHKQQILADLIDRAHSELRIRIRAALADAPEDPRAQLAAFVEVVVLFMTHRWRLSLIPREIDSLEHELATHHSALRREVESRLKEIITAGASAGLFRTPTPADDARAILVLCRGVAQWYDPTGPQAPADVAAQYVRYARAIVQSKDEA